MRPLLAVLFLIGTLLPASAGPALISLDSSGAAEAPELRVLERRDDLLRLRWRMPEIQLQTVRAGGEDWTALSLSGGGIEGEAGQPGLPVFSRLLALPEGVEAEIRVIDRREAALPLARLFPVQPDEAESFVLDRAAYARGPRRAEAASLGQPGLMRGLRVAPLTLRPVRYDPASGEALLTESMELEIRLSGDTGRAAPPDFIPESFDRLYTDLVLGYERHDATQVGPGTWLLICDNHAALLDSLQPLVDWRSRQGYNVMVQTTDQTGNSEQQITSYVQTVYDTVDPPLEYVVLAGDANGDFGVDCWHENLSYFHGEGDHYYATLEGGDVLADVHVGRLSFRYLNEIGYMARKIVAYESDPPLDEDWFTRASLCGDPEDSGITTVYVNQWLKNQLLRNGYTHIDTIWGGHYVLEMMENLNAGCGVFGYRGFYAMSGMSSSHILSATNGLKLPFSVVVTCETGSFESDYTCRSEAFLKAPEGGGIAGIGTATGGTHTRYNNCYYHGVWQGAVNGSDHRLGVAHTRGKVELYNNYQDAEPHRVEIWSVWNNLMGDPATDLWTAFPSAIAVDHAASLPVAANALALSVSEGGLPLAGARVALHQEGALRSVGYSDETGAVILSLDGATAGPVQVTVLAHDRLPYLGELQLTGGGQFAGLEAFTVDDDMLGESQGDGDGEADPGETLELPAALRNSGAAPLAGVTATLASADPFVSILDGEESFGGIPAGGLAWSAEDFDLLLAPETPDGHDIDLQLTATDGAESWNSLLRLTVRSAAFLAEDFAWSEGWPLQPGDTGSLQIRLRNTGSRAGELVGGSLSCDSPWIVLDDAAGGWGSLASGQAAFNDFDSFGLSVLADCLPGHQAAFTLELSFNGGAEASLSFLLPVGEITSQDPTGPDAYGYYALDDTDDPFLGAPVYDWVELDPVYGGPGTDLGLEDFLFEQDETKTVDLPFTFRFYGQDFDRVSICSNGWIAMGETYLKHYRNYNLPAAGTPRWMIAPFWDDLFQPLIGTDRVFTWHDAEQGRFIVQWGRLKNDYADIQNFELILYDPALYPTHTGDGIIDFQYETVNNTDHVNGYATVGIQNGDRDDGLTYSYWDLYAPGAATLEQGRALRFMTMTRRPVPAISVEPAGLTQTLSPGETAVDWLQVSNVGEEGSLLDFSLVLRDPALVGRSIEGSSLEIDPDHYLPGDVLDLTVTVHNPSANDEPINLVTLNFPPGAFVNGGTALEGPSGGLAHSGSGDGVLVQWFDEDGGAGEIQPGETATGSLNVSFNSGSDDMILPWTMRGDESGEDPHFISGIFILEYDGASVELFSPDGGELWVVGEQREILFEGSLTTTLVDLEIRREDGGLWETLVENVPAGPGAWTWTVTGPASRDCRVRVSDSLDEEISDTSQGDFTIMNPIDWLVPSLTEGQVAQGESEDIRLDFATEGLELGVYEVEIVLSTLVGDTLHVPVTLIVDDGTAAEAPPARTLLAQNHPNPFNPSTVLRFSLAEAAAVSLSIHDLAGRRVADLHRNLPLPAGEHELRWNGRDAQGDPLPSGVYFCRLEAAGQVMTRKMTLLK